MNWWQAPLNDSSHALYSLNTRWGSSKLGLIIYLLGTWALKGIIKEMLQWLSSEVSFMPWTGKLGEFGAYFQHLLFSWSSLANHIIWQKSKAIHRILQNLFRNEGPEGDFWWLQFFGQFGWRGTNTLLRQPFQHRKNFEKMVFWVSLWWCALFQAFCDYSSFNKQVHERSFL